MDGKLMWLSWVFMPPVLKTIEGKISTCKEGRIFYPLSKIRLIMTADDHSTGCQGHLFLKYEQRNVSQRLCPFSAQEFLFLMTTFDVEISPILLKLQPI